MANANAERAKMLRDRAKARKAARMLLDQQEATAQGDQVAADQATYVAAEAVEQGIPEEDVVVPERYTRKAASVTKKQARIATQMAFSPTTATAGERTTNRPTDRGGS